MGKGLPKELEQEQEDGEEEKEKEKGQVMAIDKDDQEARRNEEDSERIGEEEDSKIPIQDAGRKNESKRRIKRLRQRQLLHPQRSRARVESHQC